jgi:hypothetical protein
VAAGVIGLGGFAVYAIQANTRKPKNKSQENEEEKTNCLDLKERMEKKLAELTDLRAQAGGKAQAYARKKVTGTVAASAAGEVLIKIQKAEQEYNRLKFLLEECWAGARARKRVFIIHQWSGTSKDGWYPWLRQKLETENYTVEILNMPDTNAPTIEAWVQYLAQRVGVVSEKTFFVGHSIGVQTILRYLETLPAEVRVGGVIGVAGWFRLAREDKKIARPWLETPIDFFRVKQHCDNFFMIFSDNDTYVPISNQKLFEQHIGAATLVLHDRGHFTQADKIFTLPEALDWFIKK